jgi:hypothetical protein
MLKRTGTGIMILSPMLMSRIEPLLREDSRDMIPTRGNIGLGAVLMTFLTKELISMGPPGKMVGGTRTLLSMSAGDYIECVGKDR